MRGKTEPFGDELLVLLAAAGRSSEHEEHSLCLLAATGLRLTYPDAAVLVEPAPDRPPEALGVLDVWLVPLGPGEPLGLRVVVHDEIARGLWHEATQIIDDAVRAALVARNGKTKGHAT